MRPCARGLLALHVLLWWVAPRLTVARPLVLVAGAQKAGTSSLAGYLHEVFRSELLPPRLDCQNGAFNETRFFVPLISPCTVNELLYGEHPDRCGLEAYDSCFGSSGHARALEKSPDFLFWPHVPRILAAWLADRRSRVVVLLRDPVKRFLSDAAQSFLRWMHWIAPQDHPGILLNLVALSLRQASPLLQAAYGGGGAPGPRGWAAMWRGQLQGACEADTLAARKEDGRLFLRRVMRPAFQRAVLERRRRTMDWQALEATILRDAFAPRSGAQDAEDGERRCWACSFEAFILCYLANLFLQGMYLPQLLNWLEVLAWFGEPPGWRFRVVQAERLFDPGRQRRELRALTNWLDLGTDANGALAAAADPTRPALPHHAGAASAWSLSANASGEGILRRLRAAYRRPTRQLVLWLEEQPSLVNGVFERELWPSLYY